MWGQPQGAPPFAVFEGWDPLPKLPQPALAALLRPHSTVSWVPHFWPPLPEVGILIFPELGLPPSLSCSLL
jgi:hypothetical protein